MIRIHSIRRLWRILSFLFKLLIAVGTPWPLWLMAKSLPYLPLSSHHSLLFSEDSHHLDLGPTWVIEDNLILRFLIRSAKIFSPNQVTFTGSKDINILCWGHHSAHYKHHLLENYNFGGHISRFFLLLHWTICRLYGPWTFIFPWVSLWL